MHIAVEEKDYRHPLYNVCIILHEYDIPHKQWNDWGDIFE